MHQKEKTEEGKEDDHEASTVAIWDCGSPLYDSYEFVNLSHVIERHMMAFPYLGSSSNRFIAKFSRSSSSETTISTTSNSNATRKEAKGWSNSMEESLSEVLGIKKILMRKGVLGGKKDKTKKRKSAGFSCKLGLWKKKEMQVM